MMIAPGGTFNIEAGGQLFAVRVLSRSQKINILKMIQELQELGDTSNAAGTIRALEIFADMLKLCLVDCSEDVLEWIEDDVATEIAAKTIARQSADADLKKKSESRHSSGRESSAVDAEKFAIVTTAM